MILFSEEDADAYEVFLQESIDVVYVGSASKRLRNLLELTDELLITYYDEAQLKATLKAQCSSSI